MSRKSDLVTIIKPNVKKWPLTLKDFWRWREAFYRLVLRDFQIRFRDTYLGYAWVIIQPLAMLSVLSIFIRGKDFMITGISSTNYILSGLIFWFYIINGFNHGALSLLDNRILIKQTGIKRAIIPLSAITSKFSDLVIGLVFLMVWIFFDSSTNVKPSVGLLIFDILGISMALLGMVWFFSALCVKFKDVRFIIPFLSQLMFFATPVFYLTPNTAIGQIIFLNPFTTFILAVRDHIYGTTFVTPQLYLYGWGLSLLIFLISGWVFRKYEKNFADII